MLKAEFTRALLLRHFDPERPVRLKTDTLKQAGVGILLQLNDIGMYYPGVFWSYKWTGPKLNYGTPD